MFFTVHTSSVKILHIFQYKDNQLHDERSSAKNHNFFPVVQQPNLGLDCLIVEVSRSHTIRHTHTHTHSRTPLNK
jgi:hypothetical protein